MKFPLICPICQIEIVAFHPRSHIIPAFMFKPRINIVERVRGIKNFTSNHHSEKARVFSGICHPCENSMSEYETYASLFLLGHSACNPVIKSLKIKFDRKKTLITVEQLNPPILASFIYSIILKQHFAKTFLTPMDATALLNAYKQHECNNGWVHQIIPLHDRTISYPQYGFDEGSIVFNAFGFEFKIQLNSDEQNIQNVLMPIGQLIWG